MKVLASHVIPQPSVSAIISSQVRENWKPVGACGLALSFSVVAWRSAGLIEKRSALQSAFVESVRQSSFHFLFDRSPFMALSLGNGASEYVEAKTGTKFPTKLEDGALLVGSGVRTKKILGLKSIQVYAFGIYADPGSVKTVVGSKYSSESVEDLTKKSDLLDDIQANDVKLTMRLVLIFGQIQIKQMRSSLEESVGKSLKKFSKNDETALLNKFINIYTNDVKIGKDTVIDITRKPGHILTTTVNGKDIGTVEGPLITRAYFDMYLGSDAFDKAAKDSAAFHIANIVKS